MNSVSNYQTKSGSRPFSSIWSQWLRCLDASLTISKCNFPPVWTVITHIRRTGCIQTYKITFNEAVLILEIPGPSGLCHLQLYHKCPKLMRGSLVLIFVRFYFLQLFKSSKISSEWPNESDFHIECFVLIWNDFLPHWTMEYKRWAKFLENNRFKFFRNQLMSPIEFFLSQSALNIR